MNYFQQFSRPRVAASEAPRLFASTANEVAETGRGGFLLAFSLAIVLFGFMAPSGTSAQTIINFPSGFGSHPSTLWLENSSTYAGNSIQITNATVHSANNVWFKAPVNEQAFTTTFNFHFDCSASSDCGDGMGFMMICACSSNPTYNPPSDPGFTYSGYSSQNFSWSFCAPVSPTDANCDLFPNDILVKFDLYNNQTNQPGGEFTGYYTKGELPQYPNPVYDMSGSGINLQSGHEFSATLSYNGSTLVETLTDTQTGATYSHSYSGVNIPATIGANTAFVGFGGGTGAAVVSTYLDSWTYSAASTGTQPANTATPTIAPGTGTYTSAQTVNLSDGTPGATIYYTTDGSTPTTSSAKYSSALTIGSNETLQAMAAASGDNNSGVASATYTFATTAPTPPPPSSNQSINYPNGFAGQPSGIWLENGSVYAGSAIRLTGPSGNLANNVWYKTPMNVQSFTTTFTWNDVCPAKPARCGDGMGFMIIGDSNPSSAGFNYSGDGGSEFSWARCSGVAASQCQQINSVLVKFDLYNNSTNSDGAELTGFYSGGVYPHANAQPSQPEFDMAPSGISMESGDLMKATLTYNGSVLMETVTDTATGATYRNSYSANIPALVGGNTAYVGFGGSSGAAYVTQNLQSWTYGN